MRKILTFSLLAVLLSGCAGGLKLYTPVETCEYNGETYSLGEGEIPAEDGCNTCVCGEDGMVSCTIKHCLTDSEILQIANPAVVKCIEDGFNYEIRDEENGEVGYCIAENSECNAWEYFRGKCLLGEESLEFATELKNTAGEILGKATTHYSNQNFTAEFSANLPLLTGEAYYEVLIIDATPIYDGMEIGKMIVADEVAEDAEIAEYSLSFESTDNYTDYDRVAIWLVEDAEDNNPATILEGNLIQTNN